MLIHELFKYNYSQYYVKTIPISIYHNLNLNLYITHCSLKIKPRAINNSLNLKAQKKMKPYKGFLPYVFICTPHIFFHSHNKSDSLFFIFNTVCATKFQHTSSKCIYKIRYT